MKAAIVGAGAMGGALAAEASEAGHEVVIVDVSAPLVEQIRASGLRVTTAEGETIAHPSATTDVADVGTADLIVVFVKAQHTSAAAAAVRQLVHDNSVILSLQNGWGNADVLAEALGSDRLVFGVTYNSCSVRALGVVDHTGRGETYLGVFADDGDQRLASTAADFLTSSGWHATVTDDVRTEIWKKLILNAATLPVGALTRLSAGAMSESTAVLSVVDELAREAVGVALSLGLHIDAEERIGAIHETLARAGSGKPSMLQDVERKRKTEIDVINAAVARAGTTTGVPTSLNSLMTALIAGLERSWTL